MDADRFQALATIRSALESEGLDIIRVDYSDEQCAILVEYRLNVADTEFTSLGIGNRLMQDDLPTLTGALSSATDHDDLEESPYQRLVAVAVEPRSPSDPGAYRFVIENDQAAAMMDLADTAKLDTEYASHIEAIAETLIGIDADGETPIDFDLTVEEGEEIG